jgi:hypothetical protein
MARRPRVWSVTPAWKRFDVTDVCLAQRAALQEQLAPELEFDCVVVADDQNLEVAARHGFPTVERPNRLGEKVNAGIGYALEQGADFCAVVDSDCWVHADLLRAHRYDPDEVATSNNFARVRADGRRITFLDVRHPFGLGPMIIPAGMLEAVDGKPVPDDLVRGLSTTIWHSLLDAHRAELTWRFANVSRIQYVGLQSHVQITREIDVQKRWPVRDDYPTFDLHPFDRLAEAYPEELVARAARLYRQTR